MNFLGEMNYWLKRIPFLLKENLIFRETFSQMKHIGQKPFPGFLPTVNIEEITKGTPSKPVAGGFEDGNISDYETECICRIVRSHNPSAVFEIGTFNGRTSLNMAANMGPDSILFTLDLPQAEVTKTKLRIKSGEKKFIEKPVSGMQFSGTPYEKMITQLYADSAKYDFSQFLNKIDLVFIDGSHSYEYVINDTKVALKLLRNGKGIIIWHDYGWSEVMRALKEFYTKDPGFSELKNIAGTSFAYIKFY